jgi:hypothetical protein
MNDSLLRLNKMLCAYELPQIREYRDVFIRAGNEEFRFPFDPATQFDRSSVFFIDIFTVQGNGVRILVPKGQS